MHVIILSGGVGSRLWPVSRDEHPKPFMKLPDGESLLHKTYARAINLPGIESITTITHKDLHYKTVKEFNNVAKATQHSLACHYILEPFGKNTAAAIAIAAQEIARLYGEHSLILVLPSDHIITNPTAFYQAVQAAAQLAIENKIVTFGIKPTRAETGYGYIEANNTDVIRFIEKPSQAKAEEYVNCKNFFWNAGMFCFNAKNMLHEMAQHCPEILITTQQCLVQSKRKQGVGLYQCMLDENTFAKVPEDSIDYAVLEKTKQIATISCDIGWSDLGTWRSMQTLLPKDDEGNSLTGEVVTHKVKNCYIEANTRVVGAIGLDNMVIIDTADALLVANKNNTEEVKTIYNQLKKSQNETHQFHRTVHRPWGNFTILEESLGFKVKRLEIELGASLSLQKHHHRAEHWVVIQGIAKIINGHDEVTLKTNESISIPMGNQHRLTNIGQDKLIIIEVQTGAYLGEDDIVRFEDMYDRIS